MHAFIRGVCLLAGLISPLLALAANQTVTFAPVSTVGLGVAPITLTATASSGLTAVTFATSSAASICSVAADKLTIVGVGSCALTASQAGDANFSAASAAASVNVVANQATVTLIAVQSRKTHGAAGIYDVPIDLAPVAGAITVEPRAIGAGHDIVFQFSGPVTFVRSASAVDTFANSQAGTVTFTASEVTVRFASVSDNNSLMVSLLGVNNAVDKVVAVGFLLGDTNNSRSVNSSDISGMKARSGQTTTDANFRFDVNASGSINSSDISAVKARSGLVLPMPAVSTAPTITGGAPLGIGSINQFYSFTFTATGTSPITWSLAAGTLPPGLTLSATGVLSGTPTTAGLVIFSVQAANGVLPNAVTTDFAIKVTTTDVSIDGVTLPNVSKFAFIAPPERVMPLLNGAGSEVNAYPMDPNRCATTPALARSWQHNIDLADYKGKNAFDFFDMPANQSLSYKFTVGIVDAAGGFIYNDSANARVRPTFISITETPCNFDVSKLVPGATRDPCFSTGINGQGVNWANITGTLPASYCRLVKGTTYYLNLRFQDGRPVADGGSPTSDSCTGVGNCGGIIQVL